MLASGLDWSELGLGSSRQLVEELVLGCPISHLGSQDPSDPSGDHTGQGRSWCRTGREYLQSRRHRYRVVVMTCLGLVLTILLSTEQIRFPADRLIMGHFTALCVNKVRCGTAGRGSVG